MRILAGIAWFLARFALVLLGMALVTIAILAILAAVGNELIKWAIR